MDKRCPYLLTSLVSVLLVYPYLLGRPSTEILLVLLNATVVVTAVYAVRHTRSHLITAIAIGIPQLVLSYVNVAMPGYNVAIAQAVATILFYGYALVRVLRRSPRASPSTSCTDLRKKGTGTFLGPSSAVKKRYLSPFCVRPHRLWG